MRRTLGTLSLAAALATVPALAGCGGDSGGGSGADGDPSGPTTSAARPSAGASIDFTQVALLSMTGGGGKASTRPTPLPGKAAIGTFASQFRAAALGNRVREALRNSSVPADQRLYGAVVSVGCDVPPGVRVTSTGDGFVIEPRPVPSPLPECLAPVTTVALVTVPADAVAG